MIKMNSALDDQIQQAATALQSGAVIACPTEAVYGLSCDPHNRAAFDALIKLKQRPMEHGVLLIGADFEQLRPYIDLTAITDDRLAQVRASWPGAHTWVFPRHPDVPDWLAGRHPGIALRLTAHPVAATLCRAFGGALVSTSANCHGQPPAHDPDSVQQQFGKRLGAIIDAPLGGELRPTPIHDAVSGAIIRA